MTTVHKFGSNIDVSNTEDIWSAGNDYPFPAMPAETSVVSDDAADTDSGTGARKIAVYGLDAQGLEIAQEIAVNGTTPVTLPIDISICYRAKVLTAGSENTNKGVISISHGATVIGEIPAGKGQTLMAIYKIPADKYANMKGWYATIGKNKTATITVEMMMRSPGGSWQVKEQVSLSTSSNGGWAYVYPSPLLIRPGTEIRLRALDGSTTGIMVTGGFDLDLRPIAD